MPLNEGESRLRRRQFFGTVGTTVSGLFLASCEEAADPSKIALHITSPVENSTVQFNDHVTGTIDQKLPRGYGIIVFNRGTSGNEPFHPQASLDRNRKPTEYFRFLDANQRTWSAPSRFGYEGNANQDVFFEILAALADPTGISNINKYFHDNPNFPGFSTLPQGITIKDTVHNVLRPAGK